MISYTLISIASAFLVMVVDHFSGTRLYRKKIFWYFHAVIFVLTILVDSHSGYLPVILYNPDTYLGIRLAHVPVENFLFGFSLITLNLILYERYSQKK
jgi:lycopene cyclase domain-containing protein